jgi:hypothetical protein
MSITASEIKSVVLAEDDFGHEMRVGDTLNTLHYAFSPWVRIWEPTHGETYEDPKTQKSRQFDFRCKIVSGYDKGRVISLAVECKNLNPDLPLVICGRSRTDRESYHILISSNDGHPKTLKVSGASSIYKPNEFVGKSVLRLKIKERKLCSDGDSEIYDRWSQALASSHELALEAARNPLDAKSYTFIMPMVVVPNGSLWTVEYNENGKVPGEPQQVKHCEYHVAHKIDVGIPYLITNIHFLTIEGLRSLISEFSNAEFYKWDKIFSITASEFNPTS